MVEQTNIRPEKERKMIHRPRVRTARIRQERALIIAQEGERRLAKRLMELQKKIPDTDDEFLKVQITI